MTRFQLRAIKRAAKAEARYFAGLWHDRSPETYAALIDAACDEFKIGRDHPAYPRLIHAIEAYADMILEKAA